MISWDFKRSCLFVDRKRSAMINETNYLTNTNKEHIYFGCYCVRPLATLFVVGEVIVFYKRLTLA